MADAVKRLEAIGCLDKIPRAFGGDLPDGVICISPDVQRWHFNHPEFSADRTPRTVPGQRRFHRRLVAEDGQVPFDRSRRNASGGETLAQPSGVIGENNVAGIRFEKSTVVTTQLSVLKLTQVGEESILRRSRELRLRN